MASSYSVQLYKVITSNSQGFSLTLSWDADASWEYYTWQSIYFGGWRELELCGILLQNQLLFVMLALSW